jgi:DNA-binding transcriptional ArsR family regulator
VQRTRDPYAGRVIVQASPCYDFVVSLRALNNPQTFAANRAWALRMRGMLSRGAFNLGRFYFQGLDTALGYGALRIVPHLAATATPVDLLRVLEGTAPEVLAGYMLDTGEVEIETLEVLERALRGGVNARQLNASLRRLPTPWAKRCRQVVADPAQAKTDLIKLMAEYREAVFEAETRALTGPLEAAAQRATSLLEVLPTSQAVEQLLGGYTLSDDLNLDRITLAPSVFIYPFMSSRIDERAREAVIVFGVRRDGGPAQAPGGYDDLLDSLQVLADPRRLKVLHLLASRRMYGPELVRELGLTQPTVHHHVSQLRTAGLIRQERTARGMLYSIRRESAEEVIDMLRALLDLDDPRLEQRVSEITHDDTTDG